MNLDVCFDQTVFFSVSVVVGNILEGNIFSLQKKPLSPLGAVKKDCCRYGSVQSHDVERSEDTKEQGDTVNDGEPEEGGFLP